MKSFGGEEYDVNKGSFSFEICAWLIWSSFMTSFVCSGVWQTWPCIFCASQKTVTSVLSVFPIGACGCLCTCVYSCLFVCVCSNHRKAMLCISPRTQGSGGFVPFIFDHLFNPLMLPQVFELSGKKLPFYADLATSIDACWRSPTFTLSVSAWGEAFPIKRD